MGFPFQIVMNITVFSFGIPKAEAFWKEESIMVLWGRLCTTQVTIESRGRVEPQEMFHEFKILEPEKRHLQNKPID